VLIAKGMVAIIGVSCEQFAFIEQILLVIFEIKIKNKENIIM
jgi:hypothetical protein